MRYGKQINNHLVISQVHGSYRIFFNWIDKYALTGLVYAHIPLSPYLHIYNLIVLHLYSVKRSCALDIVYVLDLRFFVTCTPASIR